LDRSFDDLLSRVAADLLEVDSQRISDGASVSKQGHIVFRLRFNDLSTVVEHDNACIVEVWKGK
jgi:hypothetical protein